MRWVHKLPPHHQAWLDAHPNRTEEWLRSILKQGFEVHHGDSDHSNNHPDNLFLIEVMDHRRLHGIFSLGWRVTYRQRRPPRPKPEYVKPDPTPCPPPPIQAPAEPREGEIRLGVGLTNFDFGIMGWKTKRWEWSPAGNCVFVQKSEFDASCKKNEAKKIKRQAAIERQKLRKIAQHSQKLS